MVIYQFRQLLFDSFRNMTTGRDMFSIYKNYNFDLRSMLNNSKNFVHVSKSNTAKITKSTDTLKTMTGKLAIFFKK